ncbi:histidine phosphatase family protein [Myroides indicus]|uniref:Alpha-ribazole phosphatase n=1 Tax=Myroides indicus TaxID=1323422 RepID=A0A4R7EPS1_9FLAO|nr:histidine phosphatase family protein [Myroides indicus]TDS53825.1 alpha-ribazole phosphatase [Myroides indicus]
MEVYVIRHTPVDAPKGICYGQTDLSLLDTYREDLAVVKQQIPADINCIITSPLQRCTLLAKEFNPSSATDKRLMEMNFGDWEMEFWNNINAEQLKIWMSNIENICAPNGENLTQVYSRAASFLEDLRNKNYSKVLIITHAGIIRCFWTYLLQIPLQNTFKIPIGYGEVFSFFLGKNPKDDFIVSKK